MGEIQQQRLQASENNWVRRIEGVSILSKRVDQRNMDDLREELYIELMGRWVKSRMKWAEHGRNGRIPPTKEDIL